MANWFYYHILDEPDCFAVGQCTNSVLVNEWETSDPNECLGLCRGDANCLYFTSEVTEGFCLGLASCKNFVDCDIGEECYSGNSECAGKMRDP